MESEEQVIQYDKKVENTEDKYYLLLNTMLNNITAEILNREAKLKQITEELNKAQVSLLTAKAQKSTVEYILDQIRK